MLQMVGGPEALEPLREPIIERLKAVVNKLNSSNFDSEHMEIIGVLIKNLAWVPFPAPGGPNNIMFI